MLQQISLPDEHASHTLQVETGQAALYRHVASQRNTRLLWIGLGVIVFVLLGASACAGRPVASQAREEPSHPVPEVAYNAMPVLASRGVLPARHPETDPASVTALRPAFLPGSRAASLPVMKQSQARPQLQVRKKQQSKFKPSYKPSKLERPIYTPAQKAREKSLGVCVDCGSGGIRVLQAKPGPEFGKFSRLQVGNNPLSPIAALVKTSKGRHAFATFVKDLPKPCFVGATAGLRYAIEAGDVTQEEVQALSELLQGSCKFQVLTGQEEGLWELQSLRRYSDGGMVAMGGRSIQLGYPDGSAFSLPFAAFTGASVLRKTPGSARQKMRACAEMYARRCAEEKAKQGFPDYEGLVIGVTDTMEVARALSSSFGQTDILNREISAADLLSRLDHFIERLQTEYISGTITVGDRRLSKANFCARVLALRAVVECFLPRATFLFSSDIRINWAVGYLMEQRYLKDKDSGRSQAQQSEF